MNIFIVHCTLWVAIQIKQFKLYWCLFHASWLSHPPHQKYGGRWHIIPDLWSCILMADCWNWWFFIVSAAGQPLGYLKYRRMNAECIPVGAILQVLLLQPQWLAFWFWGPIVDRASTFWTWTHVFQDYKRTVHPGSKHRLFDCLTHFLITRFTNDAV